MPKINYRLIVSDFDGTLVQADGNVSEENKRAITRYVQNGGNFAISTGRLHYGILNRARELGLTGLVSCCQGAIIMDIQSGKTVIDNRLSHETTLAACQKLERLGLHYHVYDFENYYCNKDDEALVWYERAVGKRAVRITDKTLSEYVREKRICSYKILAMVKPEDNAKTLAALQNEKFEGCLLTKSADVLVEIVNANYSKGTAVAFLADYYGVPLEKTIGVGDQWNDLPMIETAGLGIAVQNADEKLKAKALTVAYTNEQSAIAKIIEKYGYTEA
ncbi:MAG: HAD family phosphatase [Clostridia bacterium]|nr:HAD family phosphatase [Clostridia bacterium]